MLYIKKIWRSNKQDQRQLFQQYFVTLFDIGKGRYIKESDPWFMQKAYKLFHSIIQIQEIFRLTFEKDMKVINKIWPHWKKTDVCQLTEFIKLSAEKGVINLVLQKWCQFMQIALETLNKVSSANITNRDSLAVQKPPLAYFHHELNTICDILCSLVIKMNQQFVQHSLVKAQQIFNSLTSQQIKQKQWELIHNEIKIVILGRKQFNSVYRQLFNALKPEDAEPLKLQITQTPQHRKTFEEFMRDNYTIKNPQITLRCQFVKSQKQIIKFHAENNIKQKLKKMKSIRKTIESEISSIITEKKSQEPIIRELYQFLFQLFADDIWKSMLYILVILDGPPQQSITQQIDKIAMKRDYLHICNEETIQSFKNILYSVRIMLSRC